MSKGFVVIVSAMILSVCNLALAEEIQVTLKAGKRTFSINEQVDLSYEVLWLGAGDGEIYSNTLAFPELQVVYLNRFPVEMTVLESFVLSPGPSRHERRVWAPTMSGESKPFPMNSREGTRFLNGKVGYYDLNSPGTYVIRAVFRNSPSWPLYQGQLTDVTSNALVIEVVD